MDSALMLAALLHACRTQQPMHDREAKGLPQGHDCYLVNRKVGLKASHVWAGSGTTAGCSGVQVRIHHKVSKKMRKGHLSADTVLHAGQFDYPIAIGAAPVSNVHPFVVEMVMEL